MRIKDKRQKPFAFIQVEVPLTRAMTVKKKDPKDIGEEENTRFGEKKY